MNTTKYNLLFTLELLHRYYKDYLCTDFTICPTTKTIDLLRGHKIIAKQFKNQLIAGVELGPTGTPAITPVDGLQLTFFLQLQNPLFYNYTNLPFSFPPGKIYYFTNRTNNISNGKKFLSASYSAYMGTKEYTPGDLTTNTTGTVFIASRSSTGQAPPANDVSSDFWTQVDPVSGQNHYASEEDALQLLPTRSTYYFNSEQFAADIKVFGYNSSTADYSEPVYSNLLGFSKPAKGFTLDLSTLAPGKYKLYVNGTEQFIYIDDEFTRKNVFAVIDIFNENNLPVSYKLMNGESLVSPSPVFSINFLNRSTIWKYILPSGVSGIITDHAGIYQFPTLASNQVYSNSPIPLLDKPLDFKLKVGADPQVTVACASPQRLAKHTNSGDTYYCSEIFLNY